MAEQKKNFMLMKAIDSVFCSLFFATMTGPNVSAVRFSTFHTLPSILHEINRARAHNKNNIAKVNKLTAGFFLSC